MMATAARGTNLWLFITEFLEHIVVFFSEFVWKVFSPSYYKANPNPEPSIGVLYKQTREQGTIPLTRVDDYYDRTPRNVLQKAWDLSRFLSVSMKTVPYS